MGTAELEGKAFLWERDPQSRGRQEALLWERDLSQAHPQHQEALLLQRDLMLKWALPLSTWMTFGGLFKSRRTPSRQRPRGRRVPKEEGILEVDAKISLERERILEQEALIRKMNANPWFLYDQGVTRLKWPSGVYVVSEYGDGRVKTTSWFEVPHKLKSSLYDMGPETWICHPFSGFSVYFFLKAHELGKWQGNLLMEMEKERVYTRLDNLGNPRTGYKSGFGDIPDLLYTNQNLIDAEFPR